MPRTTLWRVAVASLALGSCTHGPVGNAIDARNAVMRFPQTSSVLLPLPADVAITPVRPGGVRGAPKSWDVAGVSPSGRVLLVRYLGGCDWLDRVDLAETAQQATVTVRVSHDPDPAHVCAESAQTQHVRVTLTRPLRGRVVLDGSANAPRPVIRLTAEPPAV